MDSQVFGKFMFVLLCAVGVVVAEDGCATFGQVYNYFKDCFEGDSSRTRFELNTTCSVRGAVRECMNNKTANCAEKSTVMTEVENYFSLCDGTSISAMAQQYLGPPADVCQMNITAASTCIADVQKTSEGFPFINKTLSGGLKAVKGMKQTYFSCLRTAFQGNGNCTDFTWKTTYMHTIVTTMARLYILGIYIDGKDTVDIVNPQNEMDEQQNPLNARDILDWGLL